MQRLKGAFGCFFSSLQETLRQDWNSRGDTQSASHKAVPIDAFRFASRPALSSFFGQSPSSAGSLLHCRICERILLYWTR